MNTSGSETSTFKGTLHSWRYLFAGLGLILLVALFYVEENWRGRTAWEKYKLESAARGEPVDLTAFVPPPVPDDENFAMTPLLAPLLDFIPGTQKWRDTNAYSRVQEFGKDFNAASVALETRKVARSSSWVAAPMDLQAWEAAFQTSTPASNHPIQVSATSPRTEAARAILNAMAAYDPEFKELRVASQRPYSRFNLRYDNTNPAGILLPHLARVKQLCQMLQLRTAAELAAGEPDAALADMDLMFRLANSLKDEPFLISHLVRIAASQVALQPLAEGLSSHSWSDEQLVKLEAQLGTFDFCRSGRRALEGERAFACAEIDYVRTAANRARALEGWGSGSAQGNSMDLQGLLMAAVPNGWFRFEQLSCSRIFDTDLFPAFDLSHRLVSPDICNKADQHIKEISAGNRLAMVWHHRIFAAMLLPALSKTVQKSAYAQAAVDTAAVACALERHRLAKGEYPDSLGALEPKFIGRLPHDVISGQPLKYRLREPGEYVLYSVGWNQVDDGGVLATNKSGQGLELREGDWVWRLPAMK